MGLFDYIVCEHPLPLPEEAKGFKSEFKKGVIAPVDWSEFEFQTKSLENCLESYVIAEDGLLYLELGKPNDIFQKSEKLEGIERVFYTGELRFYGLHMEEKLDYWMEFKALFWKGEMKEVTLEEWREEDNSERLEFTEQIKSAHSKYQKDSKTLIYKIKGVYTQFVRGILFCIRWLLGWVVKVTWKIQRWIT